MTALLTWTCLGIIATGCNLSDGSDGSSANAISLKSPEAGKVCKMGAPIALQVDIPKKANMDSVVYYIDSTRVGMRKDATVMMADTKTLKLGFRLITARVFKGGKQEELTSNIVLVSDLVPEQYSYKIVNVFKHDTSCYTQGLLYHGGYFYESGGEEGRSSLRKVDPQSGKVLQKLALGPTIFAEGLALVDDKLIQLTWKNGEGMVYDKNSFKLLHSFPYQSSKEGWGLCYDGKRLLKSDGTNKIYFLNKDTYKEEGSFEVFDNKGAVDMLNELEYINGELYANVYQTNTIVIIKPQTGQVRALIDLKGLLPKADSTANTDVLNGIAWDEKTSRLYLTGKKWPKLFEVKLVAKKK